MTVEAKKQLFIVGSPRSGTTMLQILLASHPQVASTVEQTLFQHYVAPWLETWDSEVENIDKRGWKLGLPILWQREELEEILRDFLARAYAKILAGKPGATHIVDKHPGYSPHVTLIKRFIPGARFIHIIRDGRDVAASMIAVHAKMGFAPSNVSAAATKWKTFVLAAREAAQFTNDYIEVHYEDFLRKGAEAYSQVLRFCELPVSDSWIAEVLDGAKLRPHRGAARGRRGAGRRAGRTRAAARPLSGSLALPGTRARCGGVTPPAPNGINDPATTALCTVFPVSIGRRCDRLVA